MLAFERAKKKVEELRAEKRPVYTPSQTSKSGPRVAHKLTAKAANTEPEKVAPKPPVLEANSTKISYNIRMQYYDMMVKHCLAIYPNTPDAWERVRDFINYMLSFKSILCFFYQGSNGRIGCI